MSAFRRLHLADRSCTRDHEIPPRDVFPGAGLESFELVGAACRSPPLSRRATGRAPRTDLSEGWIDDTVGNPHRAQISQFELLELILLLKLDKHFPVEQFEASRAIRGSSISVSSTLLASPPLSFAPPAASQEPERRPPADIRGWALRSAGQAGPRVQGF